MKVKPQTPSGRTRALGLLGMSLLLAGCSVLGNKPQAQLSTYALQAPTLPPMRGDTARPGSKRVLLVEVPHAAAGYDSTRMVYTRQAQTLESYAHSAWIDTPARMLAPLLVQALQQDGSLSAVVLAPSAARADLRLDSTILLLQQDFTQVPSQVHLRLQLTLLDNVTRAVLAWHTLDVVQSAASEDAAGGAQAAQAALQQGLQQTASFVQAAVATLPP